MTNPKRIGFLALGAAVVLAAGTAGAQPTKESLACSSSKLKAYGKDVASKIKCYSKATSKGEPVDPLCLSKAETKTSEAFNKAVLKGGCPTDGEPSGNLANTLVRLNAYVDLTNTMVGVAGPNKCQSKKLGAASKLGAALFNCESKAAKKNVAVDQVKCVQKAIDKLTSGFTKEETKSGNDCTTTGDATAVVGETSDVVRLQTVATPRFNGCGNRLVLAPETCDDGNLENFDNCPSDCVVDFCEPSAVVQPATLVTTNPNIAAITILLDYPEGKLSIPGTGVALPPGTIVPFAGTAESNDFDHALRYINFDIFNFGVTTIATINFNTCQGAPAATPGEFSCSVQDAGDETLEPVEGVTCSVTIP